MFYILNLCVRRYKHTCMYMYACEAEVNDGIFLSYSTLYILRQDLALNLRLTNSARLAHLLAIPRDSLVSASQVIGL